MTIISAVSVSNETYTNKHMKNLIKNNYVGFERSIWPFSADT